MIPFDPLITIYIMHKKMGQVSGIKQALGINVDNYPHYQAGKCPKNELYTKLFTLSTILVD